MPSVTERVDDVRRKRPFVDHLVRMIEHYGNVKGNLQAGAVTYFGFLSFFPVLALGFFVVGLVSEVYGGADDALEDALKKLLPRIIGDRPGEISVDTFQDSAGTAGIIGLAGVLYAGLGWLSAMREALMVVFEMPAREQPNFVLGKLRDLISLAIIEATLVLSVAVTGLISGFATLLLDLVGLDRALEPLVVGLTVMLGFGANVLLFFTIFNLLARPRTPNGSLWSGALLGALGFEILKQLSFLLLGSTQASPAFQVFGIALILVVWINYFSRVVMFSAAWAHTSAVARRQSEQETLHTDRTDAQMHELAEVSLHEAPARGRSPASLRAAFAAGGASMLGLVAVVRRRKDRA